MKKEVVENNKSKVLWLLLLYIGVSCQQDLYSDKTLTEVNQQLLIGEWYPFGDHNVDWLPNSSDIEELDIYFPENYNLSSYRFMENQICENHLGFYEYGDQNGYILSYPYKNVHSSGRPNLGNIIRSYGTRSTYRINNDSLYIYDPGQKKWLAQRMIFPAADTLILSSQNDSISETYVRKTYSIDKKPLIDQIIVTYPETPYKRSFAFSIKRSGEYISVGYRGKIHTGKLRKGEFEQIENRFKKANQITPLISYLSSTEPDRVNDGPCITFIIGGQMRTLEYEYGLITREYNQALYCTIFLQDYFHLEPDTDYHEHLSDDFRNNLWGRHKFTRNDSTDIILFTTESVYLTTLILNAKQSIQDFIPLYKVVGYDFKSSKFIELATTDGRYYRYLFNGELITLDIGFNFIEKYELDKK